MFYLLFKNDYSFGPFTNGLRISNIGFGNVLMGQANVVDSGFFTTKI